MFVGRNSDRYGLLGPGQSEVFRIRPNRPSGTLSLMYSGYRVSFRRGKTTEVWRRPPTPM
jgi:hypothetical protein